MSGPLGSSQWMYASGYELEQSLKFNDDDSAYLSWTPANAGNRKTWTWSGWVKRGNLGDWAGIFSAGSIFNGYGTSLTLTSDQLRFYANGGNSADLKSTQLFRDTSAWFHILLAYDSTQATSSNRIKIYVNGTQVSDFATSSYPSLDYETDIIGTATHYVGNGYSDEWDGYLAEVNFLDGVVGTPADFGETGDYGEWKPIEYSGTYGTNGFYLPFKQDYTVEGFSTVTYKGNGVNGQYIGGTGFHPNLTWVKERQENSGHIAGHVLVDSVRGFTNHLSSENTNADSTGVMQSSKPDGFVTTDSGMTNESGQPYVAWNWDMGADTPTGFGCVTYTGTGASQSIGGMGFEPDLVWQKCRSHTNSHVLFDSVRGGINTLYPDTTGAEQSSADGFVKIDKDGFTVDGSGGGGNSNISGRDYVSWGWDMGNTTASNTSGSITSTVMANPTYGQSIVSWTGTGANATVGHGLSSAPEFVILKNRDESQNWGVFHKDLNDGTNAGQYNLYLNVANGEASGEGFWNNTIPASDVFSVGSATQANGNADEMIAYCFHSVSGYSSIGSYTGNASTTGPSVTTGFRPAFVIAKKETAASWFMYDNTRSPTNTIETALMADNSGSESYVGTTGKIDFNDNGFQIKASNGDVNANGVKYRYIAFAGGMDSISDYNTDGSIDSRVKANPTYGQSIVSYTGTGSATTVGHGLDSAPEMMIVKRRDTGSSNWWTYHKDNTAAPATDALRLDGDNATTDDNFWNDTVPSSSVINLGTYGDVNASGGTFIAYAFHSVTGYSKFGGYSGSGSSGKVITTGFKPAFVMLKHSNAQDDWYIFDNTRSPTNPVLAFIKPNSANAEGNIANGINFTDTGFTILDTGSGRNASGGEYIYAAFADKREYAYWLDQSGNNNDWTSVNLTESDISVDTPSNNFCTLNPLG